MSCGRAAAAMVAVVSLLLTLPAHAYRPCDGTDADVAPRGEFELEFGPLGYLRDGTASAIVAPALVVNWGVLRRWEGVVEGRGIFPRHGERPTGSNLRDAALSLKGLLREGSLQEVTGPSVATEIGLLLPTVAGNAFGATVALIASQRFARGTVHLDAAAALTRDHRLGTQAAAIVEGPDEWRVRPVVEAGIEGERGRDPVRSGLVGAIWRAKATLSVDFGFRLARQTREATKELRAGVTWRLPVHREVSSGSVER